MREIHSYLVRIYAQDADELAGVVEDVKSSRIAAFRTFAELRDVLNGRRRLARRPAWRAVRFSCEGAQRHEER